MVKLDKVSRHESQNCRVRNASTLHSKNQARRWQPELDIQSSSQIVTTNKPTFIWIRCRHIFGWIFIARQHAMHKDRDAVLANPSVYGWRKWQPELRVVPTSNRPDVLPVAQPTASKHLMQKCYYCETRIVRAPFISPISRPWQPRENNRSIGRQNNLADLNAKIKGNQN